MESEASRKVSIEKGHGIGRSGSWVVAFVPMFDADVDVC